MTAIDLSKQQALEADRKAIQQINFTANLFHSGRSKRNCLRLFTRNWKSFVNTILLNVISLNDLISISIE